MDTPMKHQLRIARQTLRLTDEGARILGGMTKDEVRRLLRSQIRYDKRKVKKPAPGRKLNPTTTTPKRK